MRAGYMISRMGPKKCAIPENSRLDTRKAIERVIIKAE